MTPSPLTAAIYYALLALPRPYGETESSDARESRLATLAVDIDIASQIPTWDGEQDELAAALITEAWEETRLSARIQAMGPRHDTKGLAVSLWSLHETRMVPRREWVTLAGFAGTPRAAWAAARVLVDFRHRCRSWIGAFSMYANGRSCRWKGAGQREWMRRRVLTWMRAASNRSAHSCTRRCTDGRCVSGTSDTR
jgi:hypothetical protein